MSDNIPPDLIERELEARFRIPNEVWTDVFKLLPRRVLVQVVSPICYRFKEISDKNVKNIHVITNANQFCDKLEKYRPEANQQLKHLAGNDCQLAGQFRMTRYLWINDEKSKAILRHCPDLFNGCKIVLYFSEENKYYRFLECLGQLQAAKPIQITVTQRVDQVTDFWPHPTFQNCTRVHLRFWPDLTATMATAFENIFNWLHRQPNGIDCDGSADQQVVRCMIVQLNDRRTHDRIDRLINRCSEDIQQAHGPADHRPFVFSFNINKWISDWPGFGQFRRIENKSAGEVLVLDRVINRGDNPIYRLRRCLAEEEAEGAQFYAGMFKRVCAHEWADEAFNFDEDKTPTVVIQ